MVQGVLPARVVIIPLAGQRVIVHQKVCPHTRQIEAAVPVSADLRIKWPEVFGLSDVCYSCDDDTNDDNKSIKAEIQL